MLSIIIPTYNEEKYLPKLLESIKKQTYKNYEIIIADNNSRDKTRKIAKSFGCKVVKGGSFSQAWNNGVKLARHDLLLLCADTVLPNNFLKPFLDRISKDKAGIATCFVNPTSKKFSHKLFFSTKNILNYIGRWPILHASSQCIFVKKDIFKKINGFDTELFLGEEHDFITRASKYNKFKFYKDIFVLCSPRRIVREGFLKISVKTLYSEFYRLIFGKIKKPIYKYEYGNNN